MVIIFHSRYGKRQVEQRSRFAIIVGLLSLGLGRVANTCRLFAQVLPGFLPWYPQRSSQWNVVTINETRRQFLRWKNLFDNLRSTTSQRCTLQINVFAYVWRSFERWENFPPFQRARVHAFKVIWNSINGENYLASVRWKSRAKKPANGNLEPPINPELARTVRSPEVSIATHVSDKIDSILELLSAGNVTADRSIMHA